MREEVLKLGKERDALQKKMSTALADARKEAETLRKAGEVDRSEAAAAARKHGEAIEAAERALDKCYEWAEEEKSAAVRKHEEELVAGFEMALRQGEMARERAESEHELTLSQLELRFAEELEAAMEAAEDEQAHAIDEAVTATKRELLDRHRDEMARAEAAPRH